MPRKQKATASEDFRLLDALPGTVLVFEAITGRAVRWNEAFRKVSGSADDEIASLKVPASLFRREDLRPASAAVRRTLEQGRGTFTLSLVAASSATPSTSPSASSTRRRCV